MVMIWKLPADLKTPTTSSYSHVMVFPGCMMTESDLADFEAFMTGAVGAKHPTIPIGCVQTKDSAERWDFTFFVHDEDAHDWNFCTKRLQYGLRWLSDVVSADGGGVTYPNDFSAAYISKGN